MKKEEGLIPIWFFIGVLLAAYGLLISATGIYHLFRPPEHPVALANLHADIWWGAVILALGLVYAIRFRPA